MNEVCILYTADSPQQYLEQLNMNRTEAKAYALNELGLDRDTVRQFGNLNRTQTWLDALLAHDTTAAEEIDALASNPEVSSAGLSIEEETEPMGEASEPVEGEISVAVLEQGSASVAIPWAAPEDSLLSFWAAEPETIWPQPLECLPELDEAWDEPEPVHPGAAAVVVYPMVIALMMLWACVQILLLVGKALCWGLGKLDQWMDGAAQEQLQQRRGSAMETEDKNLTSGSCPQLMKPSAVTP